MQPRDFYDSSGQFPSDHLKFLSISDILSTTILSIGINADGLCCIQSLACSSLSTINVTSSNAVTVAVLGICPNHPISPNISCSFRIASNLSLIRTSTEPFSMIYASQVCSPRSIMVCPVLQYSALLPVVSFIMFPHCVHCVIVKCFDDSCFWFFCCPLVYVFIRSK